MMDGKINNNETVSNFIKLTLPFVTNHVLRKV